MGIYISTKEDELVAKGIVDSAYHVHKNLGPGLLEKFMRYAFVMNCTKEDFCELKAVDEMYP
jgi:hypothetical protein